MLKHQFFSQQQPFHLHDPLSFFDATMDTFCHADTFYSYHNPDTQSSEFSHTYVPKNVSINSNFQIIALKPIPLILESRSLLQNQHKMWHLFHKKHVDMDNFLYYNNPRRKMNTMAFFPDSYHERTDNFQAYKCRAKTLIIKLNLFFFLKYKK